jgi:hypothetical protein
MRKKALVSTVVMVLAAAGSAMAQDAPPAAAQPAPATAQAEPAPAEAAPPAAPAAAAEPAPAATAEASASVSTEAAPAADASATAAAPAPAAEEGSSVPGWFRIDSDLVGLQLWAGATHSLGGLDIATDMYVTAGPLGLSYGEFDIGPAFTLLDGGLIITPMVGLSFSWMEKRTASLVPQLYFIGSFGPVYFESWWQMFLNKPFMETAVNFLYTRHFLTFSISDHFALGPAVEPTFGMGDGQDTVTSLPVGGIVKLHYGEGNTFFGFLGYETNEDSREAAGGSGDRGLAGRLTFVKNW